MTPITFWTCGCKRQHAQGVKRCRHCNDERANYTTDGASIVREVKDRPASLKPAPTAKPKGPKPPPPHPIGETENLVQSTFKQRGAK